MSILRHKHAPVPATLSEQLNISMEQAVKIRAIIKEKTIEELFNPAEFPITSKLDPDSSALSIVMSAIAETMNEDKIKIILLETKFGKSNLHHITRNSKDDRSIGFNSEYEHFYLRSENEINNLRQDVIVEPIAITI